MIIPTVKVIQPSEEFKHFVDYRHDKFEFKKPILRLRSYDNLRAVDLESKNFVISLLKVNKISVKPSKNSG
jgi:hypothetical protein